MSPKSSFSFRRFIGKRDGKAYDTINIQQPGRHKENDKGEDDGEAIANNFGLFLLNPQTVDHAGLEGARQLCNVDIVAVHGLGGDAYKTWTHQNGKLWLRDFVPYQLPGIRVFSYGYDSAFVFSRDTGTVRDYARNLLENIRLVRASPHVRVLQEPLLSY